jgi:hypothetical protein
MGERVIAPILNFHETPRMSSVIINPYRYTSSGPTYLASEDFEGTGTPSGWTAVGSPNFDYTTSPAPLDGAESLLSSSNSNYGYYDLGSDLTEVWFFFHFTVNDISSAPYMFRVLDSTGATICGGRIVSTGAFRTTNVTTTQNTGTAGAYTGGDVRYAWVHLLQSASANSDVIEIYVSATTTKPGSASGTDGVTSSGFSLTNTNGFRRIAFNPAVSANLIVDKVRIDDADIGSNPS